MIESVKASWRRDPRQVLLGLVTAVSMILSLIWAAQALAAHATRPGYCARTCSGNLKTIGTAVEMYSTDSGGRFPAHWTGGPRMLVPKYLKEIPTCPSVGGDTYTLGYLMASSPDSYTLICCGKNHANVKYEANYPQYTSTQGLIPQ